jgi:hypothetical protein
MTATHLVVLGNADTARWVLANQRMAFSEVGRRAAARLSRGDTLLFYASLKCWPKLGGGARPDSGLLIGDAVVLTDVTKLSNPVLVGGRRFEYGCEIFFQHLAPAGSGVRIASLRDQLDLTAGSANYGQALRRTPALLSRSDAVLLKDRLRGVWKPFEDKIGEYLEASSPS